MDVSPVSGGGAAIARSTQPRDAGERGLDKDSFMQLLLLQLRSQDPMNPMDSAAMFSQMAQLSMLEQLWAIRDLLDQQVAEQRIGQSALLIGRYVEASTPEGSVSGLVDRVALGSDGIRLAIGDVEVPLEQIRSVR